MLCALLSAQSGHRRFCISMGRFLQNTALTFRSAHFRCVVLLHSADEASEKRVLRFTWFSEIMRILLIGWGHLQDVDTLTNNVCFDKRRSTVPCGLDVCVFCCIGFLHVLHARISRSVPSHDIVSAKQNNRLRFFHCCCLSQGGLSSSQGPSMMLCAQHTFCHGGR